MIVFPEQGQMFWCKNLKGPLDRDKRRNTPRAPLGFPQKQTLTLDLDANLTQNLTLPSVNP